MLQNIDLRKLAEIQGNGRDVVSAYFQSADGLKPLATRERQLRAILADDPLEAENFDRSMQMIRSALEEHSLEGAQGVCIFGSAILDIVLGYSISIRVPDQLYVGPAPYIRPLAELQDEYETFALVVCDNDKTSIYTVTDEKAEVELAIKGGVKNHVRKGGWSQQRYERRRDEQLAHYAKDAVEALKDLVKRYSIRRVVLLGSAETMRAIQGEMDDNLRQLVVGSEPFDLHRPEDDIVARAYESYFDDERKAEQDLWQRIKSEVMRGGRAAAGAAEVLRYALIGRIEAAVVTRDAKILGAACRDCEHLQAEPEGNCKSCQSENIFSLDLVDAIARQLKQTSAQLNFVDPLPGLSEAGDVAGLLRY
jgi:peptide chain release factor subunit 1